MKNNQFPYTSPEPRTYRASIGDKSLANHPLPEMLLIAVPIEIHKLLERGGPTDTDVDLVRMYGANSLLSGADTALFGGGEAKPGAPSGGSPLGAATWFNCLAYSIAVMAFVPGGCTVFGQKYEAQVQP